MFEGQEHQLNCQHPNAHLPALTFQYPVVTAQHLNLDFAMSTFVKPCAACKTDPVVVGPKWSRHNSHGIPFERYERRERRVLPAATAAAVLACGEKKHHRLRAKFFLRGRPKEGSETKTESVIKGSAEREEAFLSDTQALDSQILSLAVPALIALCAEPVLSIIDTGFVGRLPNAPLSLGGLGHLLCTKH